MPDIRVLGLGGDLGKIRSHVETNLPKLKQSISRQLVIPEETQRLIFNDSVLYGNGVLQIPEKGAELTLVRRSPEASKWMGQVQKTRLGKRLQGAPDELRNDPDFAFAVLYWDPSDLRFIDKGLLKDRSFILRAVSKNWRALAVADAELRADPEVVLVAARKDPDALLHAPEELRDSFWSDAEFALAALRQKPSAFPRIAPELMERRDFVLDAVKTNPEVFLHAGSTYQADREVALAAVSQRGNLLQWADARLREDSDLARAAVSSQQPSTAGIRLTCGLR